MAKKDSHRIATSDDIEVSTYLEIARELQGEQLTSKVETISPGAREAIAVIDFGSQYSHLIARRVRECHVYCELIPFDEPWEKIASLQPKGLILSGGPASVYQPGVPLAPSQLYASHLPILGICYGMQAIAHQLGGQVAPADKHEYGQAILHISDKDSPLFAGLPASLPVWMSHGDQIVEMPPGFRSLAYTENSPTAVIGNGTNIFGLQFHPEVAHTPNGKAIIQNFLYRICGCHGTWTPTNFISESISTIKKQVKDIDLLFVGYLNFKRQSLLENLIKDFPKLNIQIYGGYIGLIISKKHFKYYFKGYKKYFKNKEISPSEVNELYSKTKIAINIHDDQSKYGCNPRFFEILGTRTFQLVDNNKFIDEYFSDKVISYTSYDDLNNKIKKYIDNENLRASIAEKGYQEAINNHTFIQRVKYILTKLGD